MRVAIPGEIGSGERRVAATPDTVGRLVKLGFEVTVQAGAGQKAGFTDAAYAEAGADVVEGAAAVLGAGDIVVKILSPTDEELDLMREGALLIAMIWPLQNEDRVAAIAQRKLSAISLDRIPRISRAQKMDVLSSMANIAGYRAIVEASHLYPRFFGGQITAAGKTRPAKVLVIGAGVAGLAAIGAARGLGAEVFAFDTREAVKEQVQSMGATFIEVDFEESGDGGGGYAKVMSPEFIAAEMALFRKHAPTTDVVVTTALIPGRPAPKLWLADMVEAMPEGGVVIDMAAAQGGNCDLTEKGVIAWHHGVSIVGFTDLPSRMPGHASQFFARNVVHLLTDMGGGEDFRIDLEDVVVRGAMCVKDGEVLPPPPPPEPSPPPKPKEELAPAPVTAIAEEPPPSGAWRVVLGVALAGVGAFLGVFAPAEFLQHLTVFVLACFVGWQVVWNVTAALHTPLMSVTNAISGIILVGGLIQAGSGDFGAAAILGAVAIFFASINISGGFLVTQRMLAMFRKA